MKSLSASEKILLAKAVQVKAKAAAALNYNDYVLYTNPLYTRQPHTEYIATRINDAIVERERMLRGEIETANQYMMINLPPRHGKSYTVTETLPSYVMGKYPGFKVILTAYSILLADDFARANTKKFDYNVFNTKVLTDNQNRTELDNGSVMVKAGILGGITGKGANLLIIDDPIKTAEEANSETHREKVWREWTASLSTRLEPPAIVVCIMTRWHMDDLSGRLLNPEYAAPLPWQVINLPLEAEDNDLLGRVAGEPLWPDRYGYDFITDRKQYPREYNALYQGKPTSSEGNLFKRHWWQFYDRATGITDKLPFLCLSVDATFKDSEKSDKVAIHVWGKLNADFYLVDRINARMDFAATLQAIRNMLKRHPRISLKLVEDKANGSAIISVLNREIGGFVGVNPEGGKEARAFAVTPYIEAGNVYLPREQMGQEVIEECASFPYGKNDDDVDAMTQAIIKTLYYHGHVKGKRELTMQEQFFGVKRDDNEDTLCGDFF